MMKKSRTNYVKMWDEHVSLLHLVVAIVLNITVVLIILLATTNLERKDYRLMIGLGGLVIALVVNSSLFKPKRKVVSQ
jgi:hypothetical protein